MNELNQHGYIEMPTYETMTSGPPHNPVFTVHATVVKGLEVVTGIGVGTSRRAAQKHSVLDLLSKLVPAPVEVSPDKEGLFLTNEDLLSFVACFKQYESAELLNWQNPLDDLLGLSDADAAARLAQMFKEGSFNPYGNGMIIYIPPPPVKESSDAAAGARVAVMLKEGSFNPYGNGMILNKQQYLTKHKSKFDKLGLSKKERSQRYNVYASLGSRVKVRPTQKSQRMRSDPMPQHEKSRNKERNTALVRQNLNAQTRGNTMVRNNNNYRPTKIGFSDCAIAYAQALIDPWSVTSPPCVPDEITIPSFKFGARTRGSFFAGTHGYGYVVCNPYAVINSFPMVYGTSALFDGTDYGSAGETNTVMGNNDSPFTQTSYTAGGYNYRLVGSGLAVRYIGNEMERGGQIVLYRQTGNVSIPNGTTPSELTQNKETTTVPVDRDWHYVVWKPTDMTDVSYFTTTQAYYCLLAWVNNNDGQLFEYDAISWFEICGQALPNLTPSESDPIGLSVIKSAIAVPQPPDSPTSNFSRFLKDAHSIAMDTLSFIGTGASYALRGAAALSNIGLL
jgi:hypothetical protein